MQYQSTAKIWLHKFCIHHFVVDSKMLAIMQANLVRQLWRGKCLAIMHTNSVTILLLLIGGSTLILTRDTLEKNRNSHKKQTSDHRSHEGLFGSLELIITHSIPKYYSFQHFGYITFTMYLGISIYLGVYQKLCIQKICIYIIQLCYF